MIFNNGWELHGQGKQKTDRSGEIWRRATSSSGGTQPRYKVQGTRLKMCLNWGTVSIFKFMFFKFEERNNL